MNELTIHLNELTTHLPSIITAYSILIGAALSPGPAVMMLIGFATTQGRTSALIASAGIAIGSVCINLLTLIGVGLILTKITWAMTALQLLGASYLLYLAYGAFKKVINPPAITASQTTVSSLSRCFSYGFLLQISNPKAIAFWLAITSVGAVEGAGISLTLLYIFGAFLISFICHGAWALLMSGSTIRQFYNKFRCGVEACLGGFFIFSAIKLALF